MSIDAMKQALEALETIADEVFSPYDNQLGSAIVALRLAIEQAERQEPVATLFGTLPVYDTAPPQRQPLTEIAEALRRHGLTLVETANRYHVMRLGEITAHGIGGGE